MPLKTIRGGRNPPQRFRMKRTTNREKETTFQVIFTDIDTLCSFFQKNANDEFQELDRLDIKLSSRSNLYKAELIQNSTVKNAKENYSAEEGRFFHFLLDAYLLNTKGVVPGKNKGEDFPLAFSKQYRSWAGKIWSKIINKKKSKFCFKRKFIEVAEKIEKNPFLKEIRYEPGPRRFVVDCPTAPNLLMYNTTESFTSGILRVIEQGDFNDMAMGIVTGFQVVTTLQFNLGSLQVPDLSKLQLPHQRRDAYRFIFYLTEAFLSKELETAKKEYGFYLLRWLKLRLLLSLSSNERNESLTTYLSLLINPDEEWIWKFIDVEEEVAKILENQELKNRLFFELDDIKKELLHWIGKRYCIKLNRLVFK